jgi:hypothetical protein
VNVTPLDVSPAVFSPGVLQFVDALSKAGRLPATLPDAPGAPNPAAPAPVFPSPAPTSSLSSGGGRDVQTSLAVLAAAAAVACLLARRFRFATAVGAPRYHASLIECPG